MNNVTKTRFGERLKEARTNRSLSMEQVCFIFDRSGMKITKQSISNYEKAKMFPDLSKLTLLMEIYKTNINFLFDGKIRSLEEYENFRLCNRVSFQPKPNNITKYILDLTFPSCDHKVYKNVLEIRENDTNYRVRVCKTCEKAASVEIINE